MLTVNIITSCNPFYITVFRLLQLKDPEKGFCFAIGCLKETNENVIKSPYRKHAGDLLACNITLAHHKGTQKSVDNSCIS